MEDYLGSILKLVRADGNETFEQSFDAWGRYRDPNTWQVLNSNPSDDELEEDMPEWFSRGYTGHEHLREFDLINMNGRMYDPAIGRMLAPDNFVQDPYNTQSYNRYAYVFNSPLNYTDPSGEIAGWVASLIATAASYLINSGINQSWNPNEWSSGSMIAFGVGYGGGGGYLIGGGNIGGNYSVMAGGSFNGGSYQHGYQAGPGLASTSMVQPAGTVNINMNSVHTRQYGTRDLLEVAGLLDRYNERNFRNDQWRQRTETNKWLETACNGCGWGNGAGAGDPPGGKKGQAANPNFGFFTTVVGSQALMAENAARLANEGGQSMRLLNRIQTISKWGGATTNVVGTLISVYNISQTGQVRLSDVVGLAGTGLALTGLIVSAPIVVGGGVVVGAGMLIFGGFMDNTTIYDYRNGGLQFNYRP